MPKIITLTIPDEFVESLEAFLDSDANEAFVIDPETNVRSRVRKHETIEDLFEQFTRGKLTEIAMRHPNAGIRTKMAERAILDQQIKEQATPPPLQTREPR